LGSAVHPDAENGIRSVVLAALFHASSMRIQKRMDVKMSDHPRFPADSIRSIASGFLLLCGLATAVAEAGEIRLKNGTVLTGNIWLMGSMSGRPVGADSFLAPKDKDPEPQNIVLVTNGWQRYFVPRRQIPDTKLAKDVIPARAEAFTFEQRKQNQGHVIAAAGSILDSDPFDEYGRRTITLATSKGNLPVIQGITRIEPDHVIVDALNFKWQVGLPLQAIPPETLDKILRQKINLNDIAARFALVRFYTQALYFPQAFRELEAIEKDFPDQQGRAEVFRTELVSFFGREVLSELKRRRAAGQHHMAYAYATTAISSKKFGGAVLDEVRKFLAEYDEVPPLIGRVKNLLVELQTKLNDAALVERLQPLRSEINEQLNFETLPRLDAFLKAEADSRLTPEQKLALAYSGWVGGAAHAITDLDLTVRYWDARFLLREGARAETIQDRDKYDQELKRVEGVGPKVVMQLVTHLPPLRDFAGILPGEGRRVVVTPDGHLPEVAYSVVLPPEYTPFHSYPLLIALHPRNRTADETIQWWGGSTEQPGPAARRGYIVIAPEYAEDKQPEYNYSAAAHHTVVESLRDARKRFSVDSDRVFLVGQGIGADAAFDMGMSHPDEFAGVIPIGGDCEHYPKVTYMNGRYTSWYIVGKGFTADVIETPQPNQRSAANNTVFDNMIGKHGAQFDIILVEYLGKGLSRYADEVPKLFDWMELQRRQPVPKSIEVKSLRKTDNRFFWATVTDLPRTTILPPPPGVPTSINPMMLELEVTPGNVIRLKSAGDRYVVRFLPDLIDFDKRVVVRSEGRQIYNKFVTPETSAILNELHLTGDRKRLPLMTMEF
jgi:hypothetical protein